MNQLAPIAPSAEESPTTTPTRTAVTFQQVSPDPDGQSPWPVTFDGGAIIHGRPDAVRIMGFTEPGVQSVKVLAHGFTAEDVERIIGLWPVFTDHKGGMFSDARPVTSARVRELTEEAVASLTAREKEMTAAYLRAFPSALFHEEGYALPVLEVGQHIDMYGEVWRYNGPDDWERVRGVDGSADPDSPNYDSVGTMDDDEMEGQTFTLTEAPA